jgi:hypothetical protein
VRIAASARHRATTAIARDGFDVEAARGTSARAGSRASIDGGGCIGRNIGASVSPSSGFSVSVGLSSSAGAARRAHAFGRLKTTEHIGRATSRCARNCFEAARRSSAAARDGASR